MERAPRPRARSTADDTRAIVVIDERIAGLCGGERLGSVGDDLRHGETGAAEEISDHRLRACLSPESALLADEGYSQLEDLRTPLSYALRSSLGAFLRAPAHAPPTRPRPGELTGPAGTP